MLIAQLSDPHISLTRDLSRLALEQAVHHLLSLPLRPDLVLITGDCTHNGTPEDYALFQHLLEPLPMPVYVVPGNHDYRDQLSVIVGTQGSRPLPGYMQYVVDAGPLRLIALDTYWLDHLGGRLGAEQLDWLATRLSEASDRPTLIFMHHPPLISGLSVLDSIGLEQTEALRALVRQHPQVERVLAGHTHMAQTTRFAGSLLMVCPALMASTLPDLAQPNKLIVQSQPPMCLLHHWTERAGLVSYTSSFGQYEWDTLHDGQTWVG